MSKLSLYIGTAVITVLVVAGGYYYFLRSETTNVQATNPPSSPADQQTTAPSKPTPDHGKFDKRFQPTLPPANAGKPQ